MIAVSFEDDHEASHALTLLKDLDSQQRAGLQEAVVVVRGEDGQLVEKDGTQSEYLGGRRVEASWACCSGSSADPSAG